MFRQEQHRIAESAKGAQLASALSEFAFRDRDSAFTENSYPFIRCFSSL